MRFRPARTGDFRHVFAVMRNASEELDTLGRQTKNVCQVATIRGSIEQLAGDEGQLARQTFPTATHVVETHYNQAIDVECWLQQGDRKLHINSIDDTGEMRRVMRLTVTEEK